MCAPRIVLSALLGCSIAKADLYTGHIASLEWKAHSADIVLLVSAQSTSSGESSTKLIDQFVRDGDEAADAASLAASWVPPRRLIYQDDWKLLRLFHKEPLHLPLLQVALFP